MSESIDGKYLFLSPKQYNEIHSKTTGLIIVERMPSEEMKELKEKFLVFSDDLDKAGNELFMQEGKIKDLTETNEKFTDKIFELEKELDDYKYWFGKYDIKEHLENSYKIHIIKDALEYYANPGNYKRPVIDRNGMGGMSAMTNFEIEDGEWAMVNGEKDHYCYGKKAREALGKILITKGEINVDSQ